MPTKIWLYYAAGGRADADRTFELATTKNLIVRNALNNRGALIANVGNLRVGDQIVLAYRGRHNAPVAISTLAEPTHPHPRAPAIEVLPSERAAEIAADDYPMLDGECLEVLLLGEVRLFLLREPIPDLGRNAIHDITDSALERQVLDAANDPSGEDISTDPLDVVNLEPKPTMTSNKLSSRAIQSESGGKARLFESYIMVDWSSRNKRVVGEDSIWVASLDDGKPLHSHNFGTRRECLSWLLTTLREKATSETPTLVGFDFAFSYPQGYFNCLGVDDWRGLIEYYYQKVTDSDTNRHNRDDFAREINQKLGAGPGPFWGVTRGAACDVLETRRLDSFTFPYQHDRISLNEFRHTELAARMAGTVPQSVWKLSQGVAVGGQVIMGLGYLHMLLSQLTSIKAWPFETGWEYDEQATIHLVEIFPSLVSIERYDSLIAARQIYRDEAQVRACCEYAANLDDSGSLRRCFGRPDSLQNDPALSRRVEKEEGWIIWSNHRSDD